MSFNVRTCTKFKHRAASTTERSFFVGCIFPPFKSIRSKSIYVSHGTRYVHYEVTH